MMYPSMIGPSDTTILSLVGRSDGYNRTSFTKPLPHPIPLAHLIYSLDFAPLIELS